MTQPADSAVQPCEGRPAALICEAWEEFRVTGHPGDPFPAYDFVWSPRIISPELIREAGGVEAAAIDFINRLRDVWREPWADGPHLHRRTVCHAETGWEPVDI